MLVLFLWSFAGSAQYKQIRGIAYDNLGKPLEGVVITSKKGIELGRTNSKGAFVFNYQVPMSGAVPVFYFEKEGYDGYYWEYDRSNNKKVVLSKIIKLERIDITGKVIDKTGTPLSGVQIKSRSHNINGNYSTTYSNNKGNFKFSYPLRTEKPIIIRFYKKGYQSVYWKFDGETTIKIILKTLPSE